MWVTLAVWGRKARADLERLGAEAAEQARRAERAETDRDLVIRQRDTVTSELAAARARLQQVSAEGVKSAAALTRRAESAAQRADEVLTQREADHAASRQETAELQALLAAQKAQEAAAAAAQARAAADQGARHEDDLDAARTETREVSARLATAEAALEAARADVARVRDAVTVQLGQAQMERDTAIDELARTAQELMDARTQVRRVTADAAQAAAALTQRTDAAERRNGQLVTTVADLRSELTALRQQLQNPPVRPEEIQSLEAAVGAPHLPTGDQQTRPRDDAEPVGLGTEPSSTAPAGDDATLAVLRAELAQARQALDGRNEQAEAQIAELTKARDTFAAQVEQLSGGHPARRRRSR